MPRHTNNLTIMKYRLRLLSLILFINPFICRLLPICSLASVQVDGIYYELNTSAKTAAVAQNPDYYTGTIDIPSNFVYEGNTYTVTSIGYCAFLDCNDMTALNMPSSIVTIENSAFERSQGLTELIIGSGVTTIKTESFHNCTSLVSLTLPKSLKTIGVESFAGCSALSEIIVKSTTPPTIQSNTFNSVDKTTCKLCVPEGCRSTYASASNWKAFTNIEERTAVTTGICGSNVTYSIYPDLTMVISGTGAIRDYVNSGLHLGSGYYQQIKKVVIEDGVTSIGQFAFSDCISLTSVRIPSSVTTIGNAAFYGCSSLTSVNLPSSVTRIGNAAFYNCPKLDAVVIPSGVTSLSYSLFYGCTGLTSVSIPNSVTSIGEAAFEGCSSLAAVTIPESVTSIGEAAFEWCTSLTSVSIPAKVDEIGKGAFSSCSSLASITVDAGNTTYDSRENCNAIIETATNTLLAGCVNTVIPAGVTAIGEAAFRSCTGLNSVSIPDEVTSIDDFAFYGCTGLTSAAIGEEVAAIGAFAFHNCTGLSSVTIPGSVTILGDYAFANCSGLASITTENATPAVLGNRAFVNVDKEACTLYVPIGSKSAYEEAAGWSDFLNIKEADEEPDTDISALANAIYVEQTEGNVGATMNIPVKLKNSYPVRGFQFTLKLPEGTTVNSWALSEERLPEGATLSDQMSTAKIDGNRIVVACTLNFGTATFTGSDGEIATVNVTFGSDMAAGTYPIYLTNCDVTDADSRDEDLSNIKATLVLEDYLPGDVNGDGKVLIGDVIAILNYIVGDVPEGFNEKAADVNGDGMIVIGDVIAVLNIIVGE